MIWWPSLGCVGANFRLCLPAQILLGKFTMDVTVLVVEGAARAMWASWKTGRQGGGGGLCTKQRRAGASSGSRRGCERHKSRDRQKLGKHFLDDYPGVMVQDLQVPRRQSCARLGSEAPWRSEAEGTAR